MNITSSCGVVAMITFHDFPSENLNAEQWKFSHFPVIFGTCANEDTDNGVDFNDGSADDASTTLDAEFSFFIDPPLRFFMPIKSSQSDEMSNEKHLNGKENRQVPSTFVMSWVKIMAER